MDSEKPRPPTPTEVDSSVPPQRDPAAHAKFHALVHGSLDAVFCLEAQTGTDGQSAFRFTSVNEPGRRLIAPPSSDLIGQSIREVFSPASVDALTPRLERAHNTREPEKFEVSLEVDGTNRLLLLQVIPVPDELVVQARDITESRRAQEALRDSEEYLSSVISNAPIIIYELDLNGVFKLSAGRSLAQIGLNPGDAVGSSIFDFFSLDSPEADAFRRALDGETVSTDTELGDGYFESRYTPRFDDAGKIVGILGVSYDVTERHHAEDLLHRAQRMEAVGQLTGGIAHDFNNLLAVILGNLDLLSQTAGLDPRANQLIDHAISATQRGANLTQRLLAFSRRQLLEPQATEVNTLINSILGLLARTIPENIEISFQPAATLWEAHADPAQLENAILNLCLNARDAMPSGGTLTISAGNLTIDHEQAVRLEIVQGDYVETRVSDTGSGIAPEFLQQIFEPFFTTKEVGRGSGLGLSMVYGFANQSGGAVAVDSEPGQGSQISLILPRAKADQASRVHEADATPARLPGNSELVLVVEDDRDVRTFVNDALSSLNYQVVEAEHGEEALALLEQNEKIDLILSDIVLPGDINGVELVKRARGSHPGLKALLTTGYVDRTVEVDPQTIAEVALIAKPYRVADLAQKVRQTLDG